MMPSMDSIYGTAPSDGPVPAKPAEVIPPQADKQDAITQFNAGIGSTLKADALRLLDVKVRPVETQEQATKLADHRAKVKLLLKDIEDRRKKIVEPIKREATAVDAEARTWSDPLKAWDKQAEQALLAFARLDEDRKRREELARQKVLQEAAEAQRKAEEAGDDKAAEAASVAIMHAEAVPVAAPVTGYKTDAGTTSLRKTWKVEVVDPSLVPDAYMVPDLQKLQAAVDAGAREIAGCNVFEHESLPVRTRG